MPIKRSEDPKLYGEIKGPYLQKSVRERIEALFLDNLGKILTSAQIKEVARDPQTGKQPENWHQRLSELRTDYGYTIYSWRNQGSLRVEEYLMPNREKHSDVSKRVRPSPKTWKVVLEIANNACEWTQDGTRCGLKEGEIDPVGGGRVKLTPDHKTPHSINPNTAVDDPTQWQALCGRHQVMKRNYWDSMTGKLNVYAIVQSASRGEKRIIFKFLLDYFDYILNEDGSVSRNETQT